MSIDLVNGISLDGKPEFDSVKHNKEFEDYIQQKTEQDNIMKMNEAKLANSITDKGVLHMSLFDIIMQWNNSLVGIFRNFATFNFKNIFENNNAFYAGITLLLISFAFLLLYVFVDDYKSGRMQNSPKTHNFNVSLSLKN